MLNRIRQSLVIKAGLAAAALSVAVIISAAAISYVIAKNQIEKILINEMDSRAAIISNHLGNQLNNIFETLSEMAGNTLFANALADSGGRDHYLRPFLNSFRKVGTIPVRFILSDFQGDLLVSNLISAYPDPDSDFLRETVDSGSLKFNISLIRKSIVVALSYPVLYVNTGSPEGALTYLFKFEFLCRDVFSREQNMNFRVLFSGPGDIGRFIHLQGTPPPDSAIFRSVDMSVSKIFPDWSLTVEVWEAKDRLANTLNRLAFVYVIIGCLGLIIIVLVSGFGARWILSRMKDLETAARSVTETKSLEVRFPQEGGDEIARLGQAFNQLLDDLNQAYQTIRSEAIREMKIQSERFRRVLSATLEGYIRIDLNTLIIEEVNDAFCRMTKESCEIWEGKTAPDFLDKLVKRAGSFQEAHAWTEEYVLPGQNGAPISVLVHCSLDIDEDGRRQFVAFFTDITDRKTAEAKLQTVNDQLVNSVNALEKRYRELTLINRMNDLLLASQTTEEAFEIVRLTAGDLFQGASGALSVLNREARIFDTVIRWGNQDIMADQFDISDCWGMRQGRLHEISDIMKNIPCTHFQTTPKGSLCVPLVVQGKTMGLLWSELDGSDSLEIEGMRQLIISVGDAIKLAISNLELRDALHSQAVQDPLTGLYNRRYFADVISREIARIRRAGTPFSVALIDLDHFKSVNDRFGHDAGDKVLVELAKLLKTGVRSSDIAFRFGGEEFLLLLPDTDIDGALKCLEIVRTRLETLDIRHNGIALGKITMSAGVAQYAAHGVERDDLVRAADDALYKAKSAGRNAVVSAESRTANFKEENAAPESIRVHA